MCDRQKLPVEEGPQRSLLGSPCTKILKSFYILMTFLSINFLYFTLRFLLFFRLQESSSSLVQCIRHRRDYWKLGWYTSCSEARNFYDSLPVCLALFASLQPQQLGNVSAFPFVRSLWLCSFAQKKVFVSYFRSTLFPFVFTSFRSTIIATKNKSD